MKIESKVNIYFSKILPAVGTVFSVFWVSIVFSVELSKTQMFILWILRNQGVTQNTIRWFPLWQTNWFEISIYVSKLLPSGEIDAFVVRLALVVFVGTSATIMQ